MNYKTVSALITTLLILFSPFSVFATSRSSNYEFQDYSFGPGSGQTDSSNYSLFGLVEEGAGGRGISPTLKIDQGFAYTLMALIPPAPTVVNPATNYERLHVTVNTGSNAPDAAYAIAVSEDNFLNDIKYIKSDYTLSSTLTINDFLPYSSGGSNWNGASGFYLTGLKQGTTYTFKTKARQGNFTETEFGPTSQAATSTSTLTFGTSAPSITFNNLNPGNGYTDDTQTTVLTTSTNAYNGYTIYAKVDTPLTASGGNTIANYTGTNSAPTVWSGTGFGYTTGDTSLSGGTANRFSGSKYAGFSTSTSDPVADHTDTVISPTISNEQFTISYKVAANSDTPAGNYTNTITYVVVPVY